MSSAFQSLRGTSFRNRSPLALFKIKRLVPFSRYAHRRPPPSPPRHQQNVVSADAIREQSLGLVIVWDVSGVLIDSRQSSVSNLIRQTLYEALPKSFHPKVKPTFRDVYSQSKTETWQKATASEHGEYYFWPLKAFDKWVQLHCNLKMIHRSSNLDSARDKLGEGRKEIEHRLRFDTSSVLNRDRYSSSYKICEDAFELLLKQKEPTLWPWVDTKNYALQSERTEAYLPPRQRLEYLGFDLTSDGTVEREHQGKVLRFEDVVIYDDEEVRQDQMRILNDLKLRVEKSSCSATQNSGIRWSFHTPTYLYVFPSRSGKHLKLAKEEGFIPIKVLRKPMKMSKWPDLGMHSDSWMMKNCFSPPIFDDCGRLKDFSLVKWLTQISYWRPTPEEVANAREGKGIDLTDRH